MPPRRRSLLAIDGRTEDRRTRADRRTGSVLGRRRRWPAPAGPRTPTMVTSTNLPAWTLLAKQATGSSSHNALERLGAWRGSSPAGDRTLARLGDEPPHPVVIRPGLPLRLEGRDLRRRNLDAQVSRHTGDAASVSTTTSSKLSLSGSIPNSPENTTAPTRGRVEPVARLVPPVARTASSRVNGSSIQSVERVPGRYLLPSRLLTTPSFPWAAAPRAAWVGAAPVTLAQP
jgi:hypothetical protein